MTAVRGACTMQMLSHRRRRVRLLSVHGMIQPTVRWASHITCLHYCQPPCKAVYACWLNNVTMPACADNEHYSLYTERTNIPLTFTLDLRFCTFCDDLLITCTPSKRYSQLCYEYMFCTQQLRSDDDLKLTLRGSLESPHTTAWPYFLPVVPSS